LSMALIAKGFSLDVIGGDRNDSPELHDTPKLTFLNLRRWRQHAGPVEKASKLLMYYMRLTLYAATARPKIFHILWNNKFEAFDRTLLMLYYRLLGKRIVLTAHNVNAGARDSNDTALNRLTLKIQYRLSDRIFVHTEKMRRELLDEFGVRETAVSVIPFGANNALPITALTPGEAKRRLGIRNGEMTILSFGYIAPYKGLEYLIAAFEQIVAAGGDFRLIVAGQAKSGCEKYAENILQMLRRDPIRERTLLKIDFIPDEVVEVYFKAADVFVLPYTHIFQSGVLFLGYSFGLPVIASDVGSLRDDIVEGRTGLLVQPKDPRGLARAIKAYFASDLYRLLDQRRREIRDYAAERHSWGVVGETTRNVYAELLGSRP
jgi:glycosyltransferase involved in cell wall biosynthesis